MFRSSRALLQTSVSRATRRFASSTLSQLPRPKPTVAPPASLLASRRAFARPLPACFSTSSIRAESEGQVNAELSAKIESELAMEKEMRDTTVLPDHLQEYLDNSPFELQDSEGKEEVVMTRTYGDEKIRVSFSIDDLNNVDDEADQFGDQAMEDELLDSSNASSDGRGNINQGNTTANNVRMAPEDSIAPSDRESEELDAEAEQEPSFPAHVSVTVERPGKGAMQIDTIAQDGVMVIDNVHYFRNSKHVDPTADQDAIVASLYTGPPFGNLDEDLQVLFEKFLDERGINTTMALFIPEYIDFKEQNEYLNWLSNVKAFVD